MDSDRLHLPVKYSQRVADFSQRSSHFDLRVYSRPSAVDFGLFRICANCRPPFFDALLDFLFHALLGRLVINLVRAQIILRDKMTFAFVRVFVAVAVAEFFRAFVMCIAQMFRHGQRATGFNVLQRGVNRRDGAVAFVRGGDVNRRLGQWNSRFRPADKFRGLKRAFASTSAIGSARPTSSAA